MTITLFAAYVKPQPDLKNLLLLTKCSCQALPPLLSENIILKFDLTAMRLIYMIFIIIDTDKYDFTAISFQRLRVTSVFYLSNRRMHGFLIFQFYHDRRFIRVGKRQKHNIRKTAARRKFPNQFVVFPGTVISKTDCTAQSIFIIVI